VLYYGDHARRADPRELLRALGGRIRRARGTPPGLARHAELVALLVEAGELAQGLADDALARRGVDGPDATADAAMALATEAARDVVASSRSGFARGACSDGVVAALAALEGAALPPAVDVRSPEGYLQYALYPEAYEGATAALPPGDLRILGIRSIGTSLAAVVAAAAGAASPWTVRPIGEPHARRLALGPEWPAELLARPAAAVAVVDEGPGLSGSSFRAVAEALLAAGVAPDRLHFLPSHGGPPGPAADPEWRARWPTLRTHVAAVEPFLLGDHGVARWIAEVSGARCESLADLSAGAWRAVALEGATRWPAVFRRQERRKLLAIAGGRAWLAEFVGIGAAGERRHARARALAAAGLAPPVGGLAHGFLVRPWLAGARLEDAGPHLDAVARYLAFRARHLAAASGEGATPEALLDMARHNAATALGGAHAAAIDRFGEGARLAAGAARPIAVDGKLEREEWLVDDRGGIVKLDALCHADAHDLVGCQDVGWDVAAAAFELDLPREDLAGRVASLARAELPPPALAFYEVAYLAFRVARWHYALAGEEDALERERIEGTLARYRSALAARLERGRA
jgi:hypothetical protein